MKMIVSKTVPKLLRKHLFYKTLGLRMGSALKFPLTYFRSSSSFLLSIYRNTNFTNMQYIIPTFPKKTYIYIYIYIYLKDNFIFLTEIALMSKRPDIIIWSVKAKKFSLLRQRSLLKKERSISVFYSNLTM